MYCKNGGNGNVCGKGRTLSVGESKFLNRLYSLHDVTRTVLINIRLLITKNNCVIGQRFSAIN